MGRKLSVVGPNPLARPLTTPAEREETAKVKPQLTRRYQTKTLGWRPGDQAALDELRGKLAAIGKGVWTERDVIAAALRLALDDPAACDKKLEKQPSKTE